MAWGSVSILIVAALGLSACGTYVPDLNDVATGGPALESDFVRAVSHRIRCDVQDAVIRLYNKEGFDQSNLSFLNSWGVQIDLTLTTDDKSTASPDANIIPRSPPSRIFNLGIGASASSEAQRVDKVGSFFTVSELKSYRPCPQFDSQAGPYILQSELKLYPWLVSMMKINDLRDAPFEADATGPQKTNVFSHHIKFVITTSGSLTPGWKLSEATINQSGTFVNANRDRTQDVVFTFGPVETTAKFENKKGVEVSTPLPVRLSPIAASQAISSQIGIDVANAIRGGLRN